MIPAAVALAVGTVSIWLARARKRCKPEDVPSNAPPFPPKQGEFDVIFLGTGASTGVPTITHIIQGTDGKGKACEVCQDALNSGSRNRRNNVSILVRFCDFDGSTKHLMVDAGKTMRTAVIESFPKFGVRDIDALLLTHGHADAVLGLDDLRDLQVLEDVVEDGKFLGYRTLTGAPLKVVSNKATLDTAKSIFPYLAGGVEMVKPNVMRRRVACLEWVEVEDKAMLCEETAGMPVRVFPVFHGSNYISLGFAFGRCETFGKGKWHVGLDPDALALPMFAHQSQVAWQIGLYD
ncbi:hypothetical protein CYMTET_16104 [Cymbomonas tetramitiformis]|uniref:Metallo-beta-lactamase domain-containing protein n=1 Tax=Cymbomonas tetramitiformis TaxID=36881 RepID=A0AAE0GD89_9CHLO|nr:hypothetical protein CYMTET_16104 [Cymbomonas tetramitiformis]